MHLMFLTHMCTYITHTNSIFLHTCTQSFSSHTFTHPRHVTHTMHPAGDKDSLLEFDVRPTVRVQVESALNALEPLLYRATALAVHGHPLADHIIHLIAQAPVRRCCVCCAVVVVWGP